MSLEEEFMRALQGGDGTFYELPIGIPFIFCRFCSQSINPGDMGTHWLDHAEQFTEEQMRAFLATLALGAELSEARNQLLGPTDWHDFFNQVRE